MLDWTSIQRLGSPNSCMQVLALAMGGGMALAGKVTGQQLTAFVLYVEFVMAASLSVCDQWGGVMEAIGASERVIDYLDAPPAPQMDSGKILDTFSGRVSKPCESACICGWASKQWGSTCVQKGQCGLAISPVIMLVLISGLS